MAYQRFKINKYPATFATAATVQAVEPQSVANVATVAGYCCEIVVEAPISESQEYGGALTEIFAKPKPDDIAPARWHQFADDAQSFVSRWGVAASDIGFTPKEMLAPPDHSGRAGFAWHLRGRPVINIDGGVFYIGRAPIKDLPYDA